MIADMCPECNGSGTVTESAHADRCDGRTCAPDCPVPVAAPCPDCEGSGLVPFVRCPKHDGLEGPHHNPDCHYWADEPEIPWGPNP